MTDANPYAAPALDGAPRTNPEERLDFAELTTKELNKLYYRSTNVGTIGVLCLIGGTLLLFSAGSGLSAAPAGDQAILFYVFAVMGVFELAIGIGSFSRPAWVRPCGIVICSLMLLYLPIGTIIGIVGIVGFAKGKALFGPNRVRHAALKKEYKHRKRLRIA